MFIGETRISKRLTLYTSFLEGEAGRIGFATGYSVTETENELGRFRCGEDDSQLGRLTCVWLCFLTERRVEAAKR